MNLDKIILFIVLGLMVTGYVFAADPKTVTVDVSVSSLSEITVSPTYLTWGSIMLGTVGADKLLDIKNTGSENVTNMYAYIDTLTDETTRPYGSSNPASYAAGGVIILRNETGYEPNNNTFAGRIEWNWTEDVSNKDLSNLSTPVGWGFFKNASQEYFWAISNGTNSTENGPGLCNQTGAQFAIEDDKDLGYALTRTPNTEDIPFDGTAGDWGIFSIQRASSPLNGSCVAVNYSCNKIYIYKYDKRSGLTSCTNSRYIKQDALIPSAIQTLTLNTFIPKGIPVGNLTTATLTIVAA
jgi:hypothetical protein